MYINPNTLKKIGKITIAAISFAAAYRKIHKISLKKKDDTLAQSTNIEFSKITTPSSKKPEKSPDDSLVERKKDAFRVIPQNLTKHFKALIEKPIAERKHEALLEVKAKIKEYLEHFILACIIRWAIYLALIIIAFILAKAFNLRKDILVAFVMLGIYSFYLIKIGTICRWYISFYRKYGSINPVEVARTYLQNAILDKVKGEIEGLSRPKKFFMNFFGPTSVNIAGDIATNSIKDPELWRLAIVRICMLICGWIIYLLIYKKLFLFVTDIAFKNIWESLAWPVYMLMKVLSI